MGTSVLAAIDQRASGVVFLPVKNSYRDLPFEYLPDNMLYRGANCYAS